MAVQSFAAPEITSSTPAHAVTQAHPSLRFDWAATGLSFIFVSGLFVDGWAHTHGKVDQSFFTLWHAIAFPMIWLALVIYTAGLFRQARAKAG